jgi:hypothetical protein
MCGRLDTETEGEWSLGRADTGELVDVCAQDAQWFDPTASYGGAVAEKFAAPCEECGNTRFVRLNEDDPWRCGRCNRSA